MGINRATEVRITASTAIVTRYIRSRNRGRGNRISQYLFGRKHRGCSLAFPSSSVSDPELDQEEDGDGVEDDEPGGVDQGADERGGDQGGVDAAAAGEQGDEGADAVGPDADAED